MELLICNKKGLHARAAAKFVKTVDAFDAEIKVAKIAGAGVSEGTEPVKVSGRSILGLMMLGAECGSTIRLYAEGTQADDIKNALKNLLEDKFGEE